MSATIAVMMPAYNNRLCLADDRSRSGPEQISDEFGGQQPQRGRLGWSSLHDLGVLNVAAGCKWNPADDSRCHGSAELSRNGRYEPGRSGQIVRPAESIDPSWLRAVEQPAKCLAVGPDDSTRSPPPMCRSPQAHVEAATRSAMRSVMGPGILQGVVHGTDPG